MQNTCQFKKSRTFTREYDNHKSIKPKVYFWRRILSKAFKKLSLSEKENNFEELIVGIFLLIYIERLFMIKLSKSELTTLHLLGFQLVLFQ